MLEVRKCKSLEEAQNLIKDYQNGLHGRMKSTQEELDRLKAEKERLKKQHQEAVLQDALGKETDLKGSHKKIDDVEKSILDMENRLALIKKMLHPGEIINSLPQIKDLLDEANNEIDSLQILCEKETIDKENELLKLKLAYTELVRDIGRNKGIIFSNKKILENVKQIIGISTGSGCFTYPRLPSYIWGKDRVTAVPKEWLIREGDLEALFIEAISEITL